MFVHRVPINLLPQVRKNGDFYSVIQSAGEGKKKSAKLKFYDKMDSYGFTRDESYNSKYDSDRIEDEPSQIQFDVDISFFSPKSPNNT